MNTTISEVLQFVEENDVKFIRLAFCDLFGRQKNISIMPELLPRAFETGISIDASGISGFGDEAESDLFLVPDPATLSVLPWRPSHGRVIRLLCHIRRPDGSPFEGDGRMALKQAVQKAADMGLTCRIGSECEFYLFQTDENGDPIMIPHDRAGYCDVAPLDKGENVRREICLALEQMGIYPETSHHEHGPGQNEIDFRYSDAMTAADDLINFKVAVKSIAARNGLFASFLPKPIPGESGSGLHVNLSLAKNGLNIFKNDLKEHSAEAESFIAGILNRAAEITAFLNPLANSYERFGSFEAPRYITWSHQNRSPLIRIPAAKGEYARMELRSPDPSCHPHLAFALLIFAGLEGIERKLPLCPPVDGNLYAAEQSRLEGLSSLPATLGEALELAKNSEFVKACLPASMLKNYISVKEKRWQAYCTAQDKQAYTLSRYFPKI